MAVADVRVQIMEAAERLFAERGVGAVSLREVGAAAGQRNNSAVQYHFGSKEGLVEAIFNHRMGPIDEHRRRLLAELDEQGRSDDLRSLVEAFIEPFAAALIGAGEQTWYARFSAQVLIEREPQVFDGSVSSATGSLVDVFARLDRCLTHLPRRLRTERLLLGGTTVVNALSAFERGQQRGSGQLNPGPILVADLIDAVVGLLDAPVSDRTRRALRAQPAAPSTRAATAAKGRA
jgi:AcrR family transcriptional regulator